MIDATKVLQAIISPVIVYLVLLILTRTIGRKLLGQITYFDFVIGITIGTVGGSYVTNEVQGLLVLLSAGIFTFLNFLTSMLVMKNVTMRKLILGEPVVVIQNGKLLEKNMRKSRYSEDELAMQLREANVFDFSEVEFALLEFDGKLSVLKKSQNVPLTPKDLNIPTDYKGISTEIIRDGRIQEQNLRQNNLTHEWLYNQLAQQNVRSIDNVFYATLSTDGSLYVDVREDDLDYVQKTEDDDSLIE